MKTWTQFLLEIVELSKPTTRVARSSITKNKGTNTPQPITQFVWRTQMGNVVNLQFEIKGQDTYNVVFYVNNTLYDDTKIDNSKRDPEILSNVFYLLKDKADKLGARVLTFTAYKSEGDTKTIRNVVLQPKIQAANAALNDFDQKLRYHKPTLVPPSELKINLYRKLRRPDPQPEVDFNPQPWLIWVANVRQSIQQGSDLYPYLNELKSGVGSNRFNILGDLSTLIMTLDDLSNALASHTENGWNRTQNRRLSIYSKLVKKYFSDWNVNIQGDHFTLSRP